MGIPAIGGLNISTVGRMYTSRNTGNGEKFTLTESGRKDAIKELEIKLSKGEITENEYNQRKAAINSAPRVVFVDNEGISHKGEISASNAEKGNIEDFDTKQNEKQIKKLQEQYATGQISPFEYRANMYMMTNPISNENQTTGQRLSILA